MARRIVKDHSGFPPDMITAGLFDDSDIMRAVLEAISETQRLDAQLIEMIGTKYDRTGVPVLKKSNRIAAVAIRKGEHYYG